MLSARDLNCNRKTGECNCRDGYTGLTCDGTADGYCRIDDSSFHIPCDCDLAGTTDERCNKTSCECFCKPNFTGEKCDQCAPGFHSFPYCLRMSCAALCCQPDDNLFWFCALKLINIQFVMIHVRQHVNATKWARRACHAVVSTKRFSATAKSAVAAQSVTYAQ